MRPVHTWFVVSLLVLISALAWLVVRGEDPDRLAAGPLGAAAPAADPRTGDPAELARPGAAAIEAPGEDRVAFESGAPSGSTAAAASTARQGVVVRGRVVDPSGAGLEDARVIAASGRFPSPFPLDAFESFPGREQGLKEVRTGPDGRFELDGLRPDTLQLAVRAAGFAPLDRASIPLPSSAEHDLGELRLEPGVVLEGRVVDGRGSPVEGARILRLSAVESAFGISGRPPGSLVATSAADGSFRADQIPAGAWTLAAVSDDHPDQVARGTAHVPGERQSGIVIVLEDGERIQGRVVGAPPELAGKLRVQAWPRERAGEESEASATPQAYAEMRETSCAADGSFTLRGVRAGASYALTAGKQGDRPWLEVLSERATARAGERGVELRYRPEGALVFQVIDARTRQPLSEFDVRAGAGWLQPQTDESGRRVREHAEGRVRFGGLRAEEDERVRVEVRAPGYRDHAQEGIALASSGDTDLGVIALEPSPVLTVTVRGEGGRAVAGARVTLVAASPGGAVRRTIVFGDDEPEIYGRPSRTARTDEDGVARLSVLENESCTLSVSHEDYAGWTSEPFACPRAGSEREVQLTPGGSVRVRLVDAAGAPVPGGRVQHRADGDAESLPFGGGRDGRDVTDEDGEVLFAHLTSGVHRFRALGAGEGPGAMALPAGGVAFRANMDTPREAGWSEVSVVEGEERELTLQAPASSRLHGRVREGGEPLAGATLRLEPRREEGERRAANPFGGGTGATTDGRGDYVFEAATEGEYTLVVTHPSRNMPAEVAVRVAGEEQRVDVDLSISVIEGRVSDSKGRPVVGAQVWAERARQGSGGRSTIRATSAIRIGGGGPQISFSTGPSEGSRARTDADGRYSLRGVPPGVDLVVRAEGHGVQPGKSERVQVAVDQVRGGVDLKLEPAGSIEVTAAKPDGRAVGGVFVTARFAGEADPKPESKSAFIDDEGRMQLDGLAPGKWTLRGQRFDFGGGSGSATLPEQTVEVRAGETASAHFEVP